MGGQERAAGLQRQVARGGGMGIPLCCLATCVWGHEQHVQVQGCCGCMLTLAEALDSSTSHGTSAHCLQTSTVKGSGVLAALCEVGLQPWLDGYVSLSWKLEPERITDLACKLLLLRTSLLPGLAFVHWKVIFQLENSDLSLVKTGKQKIFAVQS